MKHKTPYQKIMRAANRGTGLRLSPEEVASLSADGMIEARAELDTWNDEHPDESNT